MKTKSKMVGAFVAGALSVGVSHAALVGEWNFDSQSFVNSGTAGSVHDGIFSSGAPEFSTDTTDGIGYSLRIQSVSDDDSTGGGDVLLINNSSTADVGYLSTFDGAAFSVSMWVKTEDAAWRQWDEIAGKQIETYLGSPNDGWSLRSQNGTTMRFDSYGDASAAVSTANPLDQSWHLITATYDGVASNMNLYVDGVLDGTNTTAAISDASLYALAFGAREDGSRNENILIDDIQYYDETLSAGDVLALYSTPVQFLVNPSELTLALIAPATTVTGSVAAAYTSDTDVEVSVSISASTHPGAFSVLSVTAQTLMEPSPSNTVFEFEFDNSVANLLNGESATGVVTFAWNEVGSTTTNEVSVSMSVLSADPIELVGEWNFDSQTLENSGTAGSVHDGTFLTGTPEFSTDTIDGSGHSLRITSIADNDSTGGGDVLLINNSKSTDAGYLPTFDGAAFTVSMWVKSEDTAWFQWDEISGKSLESASAGWALRSRYGDTIRFDAYGDGTAESTSDALDLGWHLITATYNGVAGNMKIYIDGVFEKENTPASISDASLYALAFGAREDGSRGENILLDEIQYYDRALSDEDIAALYSAPIGLFVNPNEMALELISPATTIAGSVAVSYVSDTSVEVSVSISDPAHPGAFSVLSATPQTLTEPTPSNTVFQFEFDNTVANLLDGETATGIVTFAWNESGSITTNEVSVPMTVQYFAADWMMVNELGGNANSVNPIDLSAEGSTDWVMLGQGGSTASRDEKIDADYIGDVTVAGSHGAWYNSSYQSSWTNGSPTVTATAVKGNWEAGESHSFTVTGLDAGSYTLTMYCSKYNAIGEMTASFGGESIVRTFDAEGSGGGSQYGVFTMNVDITSPSDSLDVSYALITGSNIGLTAITLTETFVPTPTIGAISMEIVSGGTEAALSWGTSSGASYGVMASENLAVGIWTNIITSVDGTGSEVTVTNALSAGPAFYRAYIQD